MSSENCPYQSLAHSRYADVLNFLSKLNSSKRQEKFAVLKVLTYLEC